MERPQGRFFFATKLHVGTFISILVKIKCTNMEKNKIIYWVPTGLLCALFIMSAGMYIFDNDAVKIVFMGLGFPTWIIYPLAIAKILGVVAIVSRISPLLKEWAYAGFFFDALLALGAHLNMGDGQAMPAVMAIVLVLASRYLEIRAYPKST